MPIYDLRWHSNRCYTIFHCHHLIIFRELTTAIIIILSASNKISYRQWYSIFFLPIFFLSFLLIIIASILHHHGQDKNTYIFKDFKLSSRSQRRRRKKLYPKNRDDVASHSSIIFRPHLSF